MNTHELLEFVRLRGGEADADLIAEFFELAAVNSLVEQGLLVRDERDSRGPLYRLTPAGHAAVARKAQR